VPRPNPSAIRPSAGGLLLALAIPLLFVHSLKTPDVTLSLGGTAATIELADLVLAVLAVATLVAARRGGIAPLREARAVLAWAAAFIAVVLLSTAWGAATLAGYPLASNLVTAAKYAEYAVLALAAPLLLRRRDDVSAVLCAVAAWSAVATFWGALQFLGLVDEWEGRRPGQREPSFLGVHDFAALSTASLAIGLVVIACGSRERAVRIAAGVAAVAGSLGVVLSGALASVGAVLLGAALVAGLAHRRRLLDRRRAGAIGAIVALVLAGSFAMRSADLDQLLRFVGVSPEQEETTTRVQSYSHRTVLGYIGIRIFADHPLLGVGWQGSALEPAYGPYLDDAQRRYPDVPAESLPSPEHPWGIQNAFIQAAADMGIVGLAALLGLLGAAAWAAWRAAGRVEHPLVPLVALLWLVAAAAELTALGLFAGVPTDALLWLAVGLSVASQRAEKPQMRRPS
jgi:O-antigen ligase